MFRFPFVLFCILLTFFAIEPIQARSYKGGRSSYPKSGGLSGGGHSGGLSGGHGYPSSSSGSHSYPSGAGLSGGGRGYPSGGSSYPSSGGSHTYPSGGSHTYPSGGSHNYPSAGNKYPTSSGSHQYPAGGRISGTGSGSHSYPGGKGLSGNSYTSPSHGQTQYRYSYTPPQQIRYTPVGGGPPVSYPVYHGALPTYVYQYRDSGSKYGTLLAGLALLNLGTLGAVYATRHASYKPAPGEVCSFAIKKPNGDYEETKIGCELITSFIFQSQDQAQNKPTGTIMNTTTITTNTTTVNSGSGQPIYTMAPNGTLITANATNNGSGNTSTSVTTVTTTVTNALDQKGKDIQVTNGMQCFVIRKTPDAYMKKDVSCGVLQSYAQQSLRRKNSAGRHTPALALLAAILVYVVY